MTKVYKHREIKGWVAIENSDNSYDISDDEQFIQENIIKELIENSRDWIFEQEEQENTTTSDEECPDWYREYRKKYYQGYREALTVECRKELAEFMPKVVEDCKPIKCSKCNGSGDMVTDLNTNGGGVTGKVRTCDKCFGTGLMMGVDCKTPSRNEEEIIKKLAKMRIAEDGKTFRMSFDCMASDLRSVLKTEEKTTSGREEPSVTDGLNKMYDENVKAGLVEDRTGYELGETIASDEWIEKARHDYREYVTDNGRPEYFKKAIKDNLPSLYTNNTEDIKKEIEKLKDCPGVYGEGVYLCLAALEYIGGNKDIEFLGRKYDILDHNIERFTEKLQTLSNKKK